MNYMPYLGPNGPIETPLTAAQGLRRGTMSHAQAEKIYKSWGVPPDLIRRSLDSNGRC